MKKIKTIGVSTGGGDCPGLNAVIRAVVKTANNVYGWKVMGIEQGLEGLVYKSKFSPLTPWEIRGILPRGGTILGTNNRGNPFAHTQIINGKKVIVDESMKIVRNAKKLGLEAIISIGGDGSMAIAEKLFRLGLPVVGVPKTIDNDLSATDVTFGFHTAVDVATEALDRLHTTAESHRRVMVLEVMGRYAGWIALYSGLAGGADVILLPEIPFDMKKIGQKIKERHKKRYGFSIVVVAEGAKPKSGEMSFVKKEADTKGQARLGGIGIRVGEKIAELTGVDTRIICLGHIQRGGSPNAYDRILSSRLGAESVHLAARREFGKMVCVQGTEIKSVWIKEAVGKLKTVNPKSEIIRTAKSIGVCFGD